MKSKAGKAVREVLAVSCIIALLLSGCGSHDSHETETTTLDEWDSAGTTLIETETPISNTETEEFLTETTSTTPETTTERPIASREQLIAEFDEQWAKKDFPEDAYKYFIAVIDGLYDNYDAWCDVIPDLPCKDTYIREHAIKTFSVIKSLTFCGEHSRKGKRLLREGSAFGSVDGDFNMVFIFTDDSDETNRFYDDVERLAHEWLGHCYQSEDCLWNYKYQDDLYYLREPVLEGAATMHMKLCSPLSNDRSYSDFYEKGDIQLEYQFVNGEGYHTEYAFFMHLQHLIGYDLMDRVQHGERTFKYIKQAIVKRYGKQAVDDLFAAFEAYKLATDLEERIDQFDAAEQETRVMLRLLKQDIQKLNTREDVADFFPMYRAWKTQCIPQVLDHSLDYEENNITSSYFNFDELDGLMIDKMKQFDVPRSFSVAADKKCEALKLLLYNDTVNWGNDHDWCYLPVTLYGAEYVYIDSEYGAEYANMDLGLHIVFVDLRSNRQYNLPENNIQRATLWMENGAVKCNIVSDLPQNPDLM